MFNQATPAIENSRLESLPSQRWRIYSQILVKEPQERTL